MKKSFKTIGILLSIMSLAACEEKLGEEYKDITKEKAYSYLKTIADKTEKKTPKKCNFFSVYSETAEYLGGAKSPTGAITAQYESMVETTIDLENYFYQTKEYSYYKEMKEGATEFETISETTEEHYRYLRDSGIYYSVNSSSYESKNGDQDSKRNVKEYSTGLIDKPAFEKQYKQEIKDGFIINANSDKEAFFELLVKDLFTTTTPVDNGNHPVTSRNESYYSRGNSSSLAYICTDVRAINKDEMDDQYLVEADKNVVNKIAYSGMVSLFINDYFYGNHTDSTSMYFYNSENQVYKRFETSNVVHVNKEVEIKYPDLTGYKQVQQ